MKIELVLAVALAAFCVTLASATVTTFKTGPFTGNVDLGILCNNTNISKPVQTERLSGESYTQYSVTMCSVLIGLTRFDKDTFDLTKEFGTQDVTNTILSLGANRDTVSVYDREINSKSGAVGSGYIPKYDLTEYIAGFYVSPKSYCYIYIPGNETRMISALKTIHVTEVA